MPSAQDGLRILVDRLWPRGISKERADIDFWYKEITPSPDLRIWFAHKPERLEEFDKKYKEELESHRPLLKEIKNMAQKQPVTLLYAAKDPVVNHAVVLKEVIEKTK